MKIITGLIYFCFIFLSKSIPLDFHFYEDHPQCKFSEYYQSDRCPDNYIIPLTNTINDRLCLKHHKSGINVEHIKLSTQFILSCAPMPSDCKHGLTNEEYSSIISSIYENKGIVDNSCFEYSESGKPSCPESNCPNDPGQDYKSDRYQLASPDMIRIINDLSGKETKTEIYANGPILTEMKIHDDFLTYRGGIYDYKNTSKYLYTMNAEILGWGVEKDETNKITREFWRGRVSLSQPTFSGLEGRSGEFKIYSDLKETPIEFGKSVFGVSVESCEFGCGRICSHISRVCRRQGFCIHSEECFCENLSNESLRYDPRDKYCGICPPLYGGEVCQVPLCVGKYKCPEGKGCVDPNRCSPYICFQRSSLREDVCSGHGKCVYWDNCDCEEGYYGKMCESEDRFEISYRYIFIAVIAGIIFGGLYCTGCVALFFCVYCRCCVVDEVEKKYQSDLESHSDPSSSSSSSSAATTSSSSSSTLSSNYSFPRRVESSDSMSSHMSGLSSFSSISSPSSLSSSSRRRRRRGGGGGGRDHSSRSSSSSSSRPMSDTERFYFSDPLNESSTDPFDDSDSEPERYRSRV